MTRPCAPRLMGAASALWAASAAAWFAWQAPKVAVLAAAPPTLDDVQPDVFAALPAQASAPRRWQPPISRRDDAGWIFDLFTPPAIFRDGVSGGLTTVPPEAEAREEADADDFDVEIISVWREPFRLQLVGFVGEPGRYLGVFERAESGATQLARAGDDFEALRLRIVAFDVRRDINAAPGRTPLTQMIAVAEVLDLVTGEVVSLSSQARRTVGPLRGRIRIIATNETHDLAVGARLQVGETVYRVHALDDAPAAAEVMRLSPDGASEMRRLPVP